MESSLSLKKAQYESKVGDFLGYGVGLDAGDRVWTTRQYRDIKDCIESGVRNFYFPLPIEPDINGYEWSFLKPWTTLTIAAGAETLQLPDDFGSLDGPIYFTDEGASGHPEIKVYGEAMLARSIQTSPGQTGRPAMAAERPIKGTSATKGQRFEFLLCPTSDAAYAVTLRYSILAEALTEANPYAYGGMVHSETILESCLAIAEERRDNMPGLHVAKFQARLRASIAHDRRHKAQHLGMMTDGSDWVWPYGSHMNQNPVTYNGMPTWD